MNHNDEFFRTVKHWAMIEGAAPMKVGNVIFNFDRVFGFGYDIPVDKWDISAVTADYIRMAEKYGTAP